MEASVRVVCDQRIVLRDRRAPEWTLNNVPARQLHYSSRGNIPAFQHLARSNASGLTTRSDNTEKDISTAEDQKQGIPNVSHRVPVSESRDRTLNETK